MRAILARVDPSVTAVVTFHWGSLALVAAGVLLARLLEFEPGVILGLVADLTFAATLSASREALVVLLGSAVALALGLVAWAGYSILAPLVDAAPDLIPARLGAPSC